MLLKDCKIFAAPSSGKIRTLDLKQIPCWPTGGKNIRKNVLKPRKIMVSQSKNPNIISGM